MKKIYKLSVIALMSLIGFTASAQSPVHFGVEAGVNLSNSSWDVDPLDSKPKVGFQVGVTAEYGITEAFYLQSGLSFTTKGAIAEAKVLQTKASITMNQMYLQLPIYAAYKVDVAPGTKIVFNAGPYMAYGIGGKVTIDATSDVDLSKFPVTEADTFGDDGLKEFDFGLGGGVGAEFGKITVNLRYELGLTNIGDEVMDYKNRNASLTLGYKF